MWPICFNHIYVQPTEDRSLETVLRFRNSLFVVCFSLGQVHGVAASTEGVVVDITAAKLPPAASKRKISLKNAMSLALKSNRDLQSAYYQREAEQLALRSAEELFTPTVELNAQADRAGVGDLESFDTLSRSIGLDANMAFPTGANATLSWLNPIDNEAGASASDNSSLTLRFSQPLLQGGGLAFNAAPIRIARLQEQANQLALKQAVTQTVKSVILAYRQQVLASVQVKIAQRALTRSEKQLQVNTELVKAGRLAQRETVQAETEIVARQLELSEAIDGENLARLDLLDVLDIDLDTELEFDSQLEVGSFKDRSAFDALQIAYKNKPSLLQMQIEKKIAVINQNNEKNAKLWRLDLNAELSSSGSAATIGSAAVNVEEQSRNSHTVGLRLSIPVGESGRNQALVDANVRVLQQSNFIEEQRDSLRINVGQLVNQIKRQRALLQYLPELAEDQF